MRHIMLATCVTLAACSPPAVGNRTADPADVNAAAVEAQGDIDRYAANATATAPRKVIPGVPTPVATASPAAHVTDDPAAIARGYFDALAARRFVDAYALWDDGGRASGMSGRAFADSFAKYSSYRGEVGTPGRIEGGAGQRYVEVPVRVSGTLVDSNRPFALRGVLVLHKTADIDGATAAQRQWRISGSTLRPRPTEVASPEQDAPVEG